MSWSQGYCHCVAGTFRPDATDAEPMSLWAEMILDVKPCQALGILGILGLSLEGYGSDLGIASRRNFNDSLKCTWRLPKHGFKLISFTSDSLADNFGLFWTRTCFHALVFPRIKSLRPSPSFPAEAWTQKHQHFGLDKVKWVFPRSLRIIRKLIMQDIQFHAQTGLNASESLTRVNTSHQWRGAAFHYKIEYTDRTGLPWKFRWTTSQLKKGNRSVASTSNTFIVFSRSWCQAQRLRSALLWPYSACRSFGRSTNEVARWEVHSPGLRTSEHI